MHHINNVCLLSLRLSAKYPDINLKFVSGNVTPDWGHNLETESGPYLCKIMTPSGLIFHERNLMSKLVLLVELFNDTM